MQNQILNGISSLAVTPQSNFNDVFKQLLLSYALQAQREQMVKQGNNVQIQNLISALKEMNNAEQTPNSTGASDVLASQAAAGQVKNPYELFELEKPGFFNQFGRGDVLNYIKNFDMDKDEITKIAQIVENLEKSAVDGYLKQSAHDKTLNDENSAAKSKLTSYAQNAVFDSNNNKVFTREEIGKMSGDEFVKNEKLIMEQVRQGLIK